MRLTRRGKYQEREDALKNYLDLKVIRPIHGKLTKPKSMMVPQVDQYSLGVYPGSLTQNVDKGKVGNGVKCWWKMVMRLLRAIFW